MPAEIVGLLAVKPPSRVEFKLPAHKKTSSTEFNRNDDSAFLS